MWSSSSSLVDDPRLTSESVVSNPLFEHIQTVQPELYGMISANSWTVCVPHSTSISDGHFNDHFIKSHILQRSPYFKEEYVTRNGQCVTIRDGHIATKTGFDLPRRVRIISNELFYSDDLSSKFTVYLVSAPLCSLPHEQSRLVGPSLSIGREGEKPSSSGAPSLPAQTSRLSRILKLQFEERKTKHWEALLRNWLPPKVFQQVSLQLELFTRDFNSSYVMIKGLTPHTRAKLERFREGVFTQLIRDNKACSLNSSQLSQLKVALDCLIQHRIYDRVFTQLRRQFEFEDLSFFENLCRLNGSSSMEDDESIVDTSGDSRRRTLGSSSSKLTPFKLGIRAELECDLNLPCQQLSLLDDFTTPVLKLGCLKRTATLIRQSIDQRLEQAAGPPGRGGTGAGRPSSKSVSMIGSSRKKAEDLAVTTDDMISLMSFCLIQCEMRHVISSLEYLQYFHFQTDLTSPLDYFQATFESCVQFIRNDLFVFALDKGALSSSLTAATKLPSSSLSSSSHSTSMSSSSIIPSGSSLTSSHKMSRLGRAKSEVSMPSSFSSGQSGRVEATVSSSNPFAVQQSSSKIGKLARHQGRRTTGSVSTSSVFQKESDDRPADRSRSGGVSERKARSSAVASSSSTVGSSSLSLSSSMKVSDVSSQPSGVFVTTADDPLAALSGTASSESGRKDGRIVNPFDMSVDRSSKISSAASISSSVSGVGSSSLRRSDPTTVPVQSMKIKERARGAAKASQYSDELSALDDILGDLGGALSLDSHSQRRSGQW